MEEEAQPFLDAADQVSNPRSVGGALYRRIRVEGLELLLVRSGIGFVNAAGAATSAILQVTAEHRRPVLISAGTAGGLGPDVSVGDVVVGREYVNLDADARVFGYRLGQVPGMPASYFVDEHLLAAIATFGAAAAWQVHLGMSASSYSFITPLRSTGVRTDFPAVASVDMESIAIAQTSHVHEVPFVSIRGISDLAGPSAATDFTSNAPLAATHSAQVTLHLAHRLAG